MNADLDPVRGPGNRHGVEHAGRQRITHRADAGGLAVRPGFETDVENDGDAFAVGPRPSWRLLLHSRPRQAHIARTGRTINHTKVCRVEMGTRPKRATLPSAIGVLSLARRHDVSA